MKKQIKHLTMVIIAIACFTKAFSQQSIDAYITDSTLNNFVIVASSANSLSSPVDIDFYPNQSQRPFELWILNQGTESSGGSTVIVKNANLSTRTSKYVKDGNAWHFMSMASALAFGDSLWATSADVLDANHKTPTTHYAGPTLWPSDLNIYGIVGNPSTSQVNGSHLDMIHQSPYSKGIAFEKDLVYWVLDGYEGNLKRYNYVATHQAGGSDHSAGSVQVYTDFSFTKHATLPSHIIIDDNRKFLYGCDPVGKRIFRVDIKSGNDFGAMNKINIEPLASYEKFTGLVMKDIVTTGLTSPVGIDIYGNRLIITDNGSKEIIIYDITNNYIEVGRIKLNYATTPDVMGVKVGPDGKIYFADKLNKKVYLIDNSKVFATGISTIQNTFSNISAFPNPSSETWNINGNSQNKITSATLYNSLGEIIGIQTATQNANSFSLNINNQNLASGLYVLRLSNTTSTQTIRLVKE